jgi:glutamine cyclotransferase
MRYLPVAILITFIISCGPAKKAETIVDEDIISYSVLRSMPHDIHAFTEGFLIHNGQLYESTGEYGSSWIGIVDINTGEADKKVEFSQKHFGEGITILNNKVYHLTYKQRTGYVYDLKTFKEVNQFTYRNAEGWGMTNDGTSLIMSDGTDKLTFLDTVDYAVAKTLPVKYKGQPIKNLNELEYVNGFIYANIWETNRIAKINATTGEVVGFLDLTNLVNQIQQLKMDVDVLNGIAWHESTKTLLVTGKYWPLIYVLKVD